MHQDNPVHSLRTARLASPQLAATTIHVCPLAAIGDVVRQANATHLMTVINAHTPVDRPETIPIHRHLRVLINDIPAPQDGLVHAQAPHIEEIIAFARDWNHEAPMVIHCWAGISRSTAAALISLCALNEPGVESQIATAIRRASPTATPNPLMVSIADDLLGRGGRMVDAVRAIGEGKLAVAGAPFAIPSRFVG